MWKLYHLSGISRPCCPPAFFLFSFLLSLLTNVYFSGCSSLCIPGGIEPCCSIQPGIHRLLQRMDKLGLHLNICNLSCVQSPTGWTALRCSYYSQWPGRVTGISVKIKYLLLTHFRRAALRDGLSLCRVTWNGKLRAFQQSKVARKS